MLNGENAIPESWRENLREYRIVSQIADDLASGFEADGNGHGTENRRQKYPGY